MKTINVTTPGDLPRETSEVGWAEAERLHRETPPDERGPEPPITFEESWAVPILWGGELTAVEELVARHLLVEAIRQRWAELREREAPSTTPGLTRPLRAIVKSIE